MSTLNETVENPEVEGRKLSIAEALREALREEMQRDERVILLGEDIGIKGGFGGAFTVTLGLSDEFGSHRVLDTPISEAGFTGIAIGAALGGLRPVADVQYGDFLFLAMDQLANHAAKMRYMSGGKLRVPMVMRAPVGATTRGAQHAQSLESYFIHVPGLKVVVPSTPYDARGLLRSSIRDEDPVLFFEHKKMYRSVRGDVPDTDYTVPLGKAKITHPGSQVTVVAYGLMAHYALEAADRVAEDGISAEVVDLRTLRPLDRETLLDSVRKTGKCLIVYEDNKFGGYGAEVAAIVAEEAFDYLDGPVTRIAGPEVPGVPYNHVLEDWFMVNPEKIAEGIRKLAAY
jgi:2-oxoisovalerate dehydrogenase E1 component beta subunit